MKNNHTFISFLVLGAAALTACTTAPQIAQEAPPSKPDVAYNECLRENMAVSIAWEAIEKMCREKASGPTSLLPGEPQK